MASTVSDSEPQRLIMRQGAPTLVVLLVCLLYVAVILAQAGGDPLVFVDYDGHFAYQIALRLQEAPPYLDAPAYRFQRILYPLAARLLALGQADWIPWSLLALNVAAVGAGTWLTGQLLAQTGTSRWYALVYGLYGGQLVALRTNLAEPLSQALVMVAILAWSRERRGLSALAFAAAALTKETTLVFLAAYGLACLAERQWRGTLALGLAALPFLAWQALLWRWLGTPGFGSGGAGATPFTPIPLGGWLEILPAGLLPFLLVSLVVVPMSIFPAVAGIALSLKRLWQGLHHPYVYALLLNGVAILFLPRSTMQEPAAMVRLTTGLMVSMLLVGGLIGSGRILNYSVLWIFTNALLIKDTAA
jgi:hypothetical protein